MLISFLEMLQAIGFFIGAIGLMLSLAVIDGWRKKVSGITVSICVAVIFLTVSSHYENQVKVNSAKQINHLPEMKANVTSIIPVPEYQGKSGQGTATGNLSIVALYQGESGLTNQTRSLSPECLIYDLSSGEKPYMNYRYLSDDIEGYNHGLYFIQIHVPVDYQLKS